MKELPATIHLRSQETVASAQDAYFCGQVSHLLPAIFLRSPATITAAKYNVMAHMSASTNYPPLATAIHLRSSKTIASSKVACFGGQVS